MALRALAEAAERAVLRRNLAAEARRLPARRRAEADRRPQAEKRAPAGTRWVTVYEVVQYYGGPEEGGWWYHIDRPEYSVHVRPGQHAARVLEAVRAVYGAGLDRYGEGYFVAAERSRGENRSDRGPRPHYE